MSKTKVISDIIRIAFFVLFFSIGAAAMGLSVLCEDLVKYYRNVQLTASARKSIEKLETLNEYYGSIIENMEADPNIFRRLAPPSIGAQYKDPNAIYPRTAARQLAAARKALANPNEEEKDPAIPTWLSRCSEPQKRMMLFFAGAALFLVASVCFRPLKNIY